jgi:hypothetical protein
MLTDDEIKALRDSPVIKEGWAKHLTELCTRLLDAEAMVKHGDIKDTADYLVEALEQQEKEALQARVKVLEEAGSALIADVKRRHPGEELRCQYMRALDAALQEQSNGQ